MASKTALPYILEIASNQSICSTKKVGVIICSTHQKSWIHESFLSETHPSDIYATFDPSYVKLPNGLSTKILEASLSATL